MGSAALTEAEAWVKEQFESWGLEVMVQEAGQINVGFNRGPWYGRMLSEDGMTLHFGTPSYTAGTKGKQTGHVVMEPKNQRDFNRMKAVLKGAWVLLDSPSNGMALDWREQSDTLFYREMVDAGVLGFIRSAAVPLRILYDRAHCYDITMETLPTVCDILLDEAPCKQTTEGEIRLTSSLEENPGYVTFAVTDTGPGVAPENAEKIFERFTKLNDFVQGTGLGLSICRDIAGRMGAKVFLDTSYTAGGARFVFMVPIEPPQTNNPS